MNSVSQTAAKVVEELNQSNKNSGEGRKEGTQHTKARMGEFLN